VKSSKKKFLPFNDCVSEIGPKYTLIILTPLRVRGISSKTSTAYKRNNFSCDEGLDACFLCPFITSCVTNNNERCCNNQSFECCVDSVVRTNS
jgi:hypothetical protein